MHNLYFDIDTWRAADGNDRWPLDWWMGGRDERSGAKIADTVQKIMAIRYILITLKVYMPLLHKFKFILLKIAKILSDLRQKVDKMQIETEKHEQAIVTGMRSLSIYTWNFDWEKFSQYFRQRGRESREDERTLRPRTRHRRQPDYRWYQCAFLT